MTRRKLTDRDRAQQALDVAQRRASKADARAKALRRQSLEAEEEATAAAERLAYAKRDPALKNKSETPGEFHAGPPVGTTQSGPARGDSSDNTNAAGGEQ